MGRLVAWLPALLKELNSGLNNSHLVTTLAEAHALEQARQFCLDLWPFIKELPENIACVRSSLPKDMEDGQRLLAELADEENIYRSLFIQQCLLAGIAEKDLIEPNINPIAENLKVLMSKLCRSDDYTDGFLAIITAELAATQFARTIVPFYEQYFQKHAAAFESQQTIDNGMAWLRLHAKPQTRNALLLNRGFGSARPR